MLRAGEDEPDSSFSSAAALVHASRPYDYIWWYSTLRSGISRVILRHVSYMVTSNLLHLRVSVSGVDDLGGDVCGDHDPPLLLSVV